MKHTAATKGIAPGTGRRPAVGFDSEAEFDDLASAVAVLCEDDFRGLSDALCATGSWGSDDRSGHIGGGFLANQY